MQLRIIRIGTDIAGKFLGRKGQQYQGLSRQPL
jgi:hypothetical protein